MPSSILPGTPATVAAHDRRVYTVLPQDGLTALDHGVTELYISGLMIYRRYCTSVLLSVGVAVSSVHVGEARLCALGCARVNIVDHGGLHRCEHCASLINNVHISSPVHDEQVDVMCTSLGYSPSVSPLCQELSTYER